MKNYLILILFLALLPMINSCGTIYGAAVDERNVGTIVSDHKIKGTILKKFADDDVLGVLDFSVSSYMRHVYLIGEYENQAQKDRAINLSKNEKGVTGITTYLIPKNPKSTCGTAQNLELTAKVKANLIADKDIWSTNIDVKTIQCEVVLWGLVGSKEEINKAISHAESVEDVASVKSFLKSTK